MPSKQYSSLIWDYFRNDKNDRRKAICIECQVILSRGDPKRFSNSNLLSHLKKKHLYSYKDYVKKKNDIIKLSKSKSRAKSSLTTKAHNSHLCKEEENFSNRVKMTYEQLWTSLHYLSKEIDGTKIENYSAYPKVVIKRLTQKQIDEYSNPVTERNSSLQKIKEEVPEDKSVEDVLSERENPKEPFTGFKSRKNRRRNTINSNNSERIDKDVLKELTNSIYIKKSENVDEDVLKKVTESFGPKKSENVDEDVLRELALKINEKLLKKEMHKGILDYESEGVSESSGNRSDGSDFHSDSHLSSDESLQASPSPSPSPSSLGSSLSFRSGSRTLSRSSSRSTSRSSSRSSFISVSSLSSSPLRKKRPNSSRRNLEQPVKKVLPRRKGCVGKIYKEESSESESLLENPPPADTEEEKYLESSKKLKFKGTRKSIKKIVSDDEDERMEGMLKGDQIEDATEEISGNPELENKDTNKGSEVKKTKQEGTTTNDNKDLVNPNYDSSPHSKTKSPKESKQTCRNTGNPLRSVRVGTLASQLKEGGMEEEVNKICSAPVGGKNNRKRGTRKTTPSVKKNCQRVKRVPSNRKGKNSSSKPNSESNSGQLRDVKNVQSTDIRNFICAKEMNDASLVSLPLDNIISEDMYINEKTLELGNLDSVRDVTNKLTSMMCKLKKHKIELEIEREKELKMLKDKYAAVISKVEEDVKMCNEIDFEICNELPKRYEGRTSLNLELQSRIMKLLNLDNGNKEYLENMKEFESSRKDSRVKSAFPSTVLPLPSFKEFFRNGDNLNSSYLRDTKGPVPIATLGGTTSFQSNSSASDKHSSTNLSTPSFVSLSSTVRNKQDSITVSSNITIKPQTDYPSITIQRGRMNKGSASSGSSNLNFQYGSSNLKNIRYSPCNKPQASMTFERKILPNRSPQDKSKSTTPVSQDLANIQFKVQVQHSPNVEVQQVTANNNQTNQAPSSTSYQQQFPNIVPLTIPSLPIVINNDGQGTQMTGLTPLQNKQTIPNADQNLHLVRPEGLGGILLNRARSSSVQVQSQPNLIYIVSNTGNNTPTLIPLLPVNAASLPESVMTSSIKPSPN